MAENSYFWETDGTGDGTLTGITATQMREIFRALFGGHLANLGGIRPDYLNKFAVSGTSSPVAVATGLAVVYGLVEINSASVNVAIPTPSVNPRIDRIVLRASSAPHTVRITKIAGSENVSPTAPALTQVAGTTWDIPLAQVHITTGGVIVVTDEREWLTLVGDGSITAAKIADGATLAEILDDDGTGSGLDADLLDGLHATSFLTANEYISRYSAGTGTTISSSSYSAVNLATQLALNDPNSRFTYASNQITVNTTGDYVIDVHAWGTWSSGSSAFTMSAYLYKGGAANKHIGFVFANATTFVLECHHRFVLSLTAGDVLDVRLNRNTGTDPLLGYGEITIQRLK